MARVSNVINYQSHKITRQATASILSPRPSLPPPSYFVRLHPFLGLHLIILYINALSLSLAHLFKIIVLSLSEVLVLQNHIFMIENGRGLSRGQHYTIYKYISFSIYLIFPVFVITNKDLNF
jgi:hypothetical protein